MPGQGIPQAAFTSGELSPSLGGRVDFAKYYTGLSKCENFIVRQYGGVTNRPGTRYCVEARYSGSKKIKLVPFQFSTSQSYILEFGDYYFRVIMKDPTTGLSGYVETAPGSGIPVTITTIYPEASLPKLRFVQSFDVMDFTHPSYPPQQLSRFSHTSWTFVKYPNVNGPFRDINIDNSITMISSGQTGTVTITSNVDFFTSDMVGMMLYLEADPNAQAASSRQWEVQKVIAINDMRRAGANFYKALSAGTTGTVRPTVLEGFEYDGDPGVAWQYQHSGFGIILLTGFTDRRTVSGNVLQLLPDSLVSASVARAITNAVAGGSTVDVTVAAHGFVSGDFYTISGVVGMTSLNGSWQISVVDVNTFRVPLTTIQVYTSGGTASKTLTASASYKWALEAWGSDFQYPGTVSYFQQRQIFAASAGKPQSLWMSTSGGFTDYTRSVPVQDDDACQYTLASKELNEIRHAVDLTKLLLFTSGGVWLVQGNADGVITPAAVNVKKQVQDGCSDLAPLVIGSEALFVDDVGTGIKAVGYNWQKDSYLGQDLTVMSSHLFENHQVVAWAYQKKPFSCVWAVREDGTMLCLTYLPEQEVIGWSRHVTDGLIEDVAVIMEGTEYSTYVTVLRTIGGIQHRFIEKFATRLVSDIRDAYIVDCGLSYSGTPVTSFSGLDHLEGETVSILADGRVHPQRVVTGGAITLDYPASKVHAGLPYTASMQTMDMSLPNSPLIEKQKNVNQVTVLAQETVGLMAGPDKDHLSLYRPPSITNYGDPLIMVTDQCQIKIASGWSKGGNVYIQQDQPLPITILALVPDVTVGGS